MKRELFLLMILLSGCTPGYLVSKEEVKAIPRGCREVLVRTSYSADSLLNNFTRALLKDGWTIDADRSLRQIVSNGRSIGSGTFMRSQIYVEPEGAGSVAYITGEWGHDSKAQVNRRMWVGVSTNGLQPIIFGKASKSDLAFQQLVVFGKDIPGGTVTYGQ